MYRGKTVLVTGGTGSFGRAFVRHALAHLPYRRIIIYSRDEHKQYEMQQELAADAARLRFFIGDVRDRERLYRAFHGVDHVIHAAALKHVPLMEYNPIEAVNTNILGARNIIDAAIDRQVTKVVALSTDKAVNPVNLYGATKLVSDKLFRSAQAYSAGGPAFTVVRYGNVVGSRGSVVPFFRKLRAQGARTLPITDPGMTRFWITLEQAVEMVLTAIELGHGGEVFVGRIPSCRVTDLARAIHPDAELETVGIRPGEKLHEVLITEEDARTTFAHDGLYVIYPAAYASVTPRLVAPNGRRVPPDFRYASDSNEQWLDVDDLRRLLTGIPEPQVVGV
ncbi:MAG: UDP-N-acetylglucosamine 4,6-dehydratase (inverting) [Candidatus Krumholzibacteriia bacterium]